MRTGTDFLEVKKIARQWGNTGQSKLEEVELPERSILPVCRRIYLEFVIHSQKWGFPTNAGIALIYLHLHPDDLEPAAIAQNALFPRQTMTFILDSFEKKGLAVRKPHPRDRRRKIIQLSPGGKQLAAAMFKDYLDFEQKALRSFADKELHTLKTSLSRYADALARQNK